MKTGISVFWQSLVFFVFMTLVLGVVYPLLITGVSQVFFFEKANGSFIKHGESVVGSELISQAFKDPKHFWPRPSAVDFNPASSGASNLGPTSAVLKTKISEWQSKSEEPFASGSGLDPHISPESAMLQLNRVAQARHLDANGRGKLTSLVNSHIEDRQFGFLGERRVNVLKLNLASDTL